MNGVIIIDKPAGWTSHDVVNRMRRILGQRSIGHLGTLDPLATGVLPLVTGSLTRLAQFYTTSEKSYEGVIRFGFATNTHDADGEPIEVVEANMGTAAPSAGSGQAPGCPDGRRPDLSLDDLQKLAARFQGPIEQVPPSFSAKKIHGVPAYKLARKQKEVILKPVQVEIKEFAILAVEGDRARFRARVSSGTYMRSLAHEMGQRVGSGAHLESLRRTAVAEFEITQAHTLDEIETQIKQGRIKEEQLEDSRVKGAQGPQTQESRIRDCHSDRSFAFPKGKGSGVEEPAAAGGGNTLNGPPRAQISPAIIALFIHPRLLLPQLPSVTVDDATAARIRSGRPVNLPELSRARQVKVFYGQSELIAIATRIAGTLFHPKIVFPQQ